MPAPALAPAAVAGAAGAGSAGAAGGGATKEFLQQAAKDTKLLKEGLKLLAGNWLEVNDAAFKTARTMAFGREQAHAYNKLLLSVTRDIAAQFGVTAKELADFQKSYSEAIGRNVVLTKQQLAHMSALAKITDNATAAQLVDEFDKIGVGVAGTTAKVGLMQERAKALGINATKATKILKDNIQQASRYSFRNGVNDIEKMALKAASMRMDMDAIMRSTESFETIEDAIGASAKIQMLGGSFARNFSNPMGVMFEAQADPKAYMERILNTTKGYGTYNKQTGAVEFNPLEMRFLKEFAKDIGMSIDEVSRAASSQVQNAEVEKELRAKGNYAQWTPKDLEAIQNLSRTNVDEETGKHYITYLDKDGQDHRAFIEDLTKEQLELAKGTRHGEEGLWDNVQDIKTILERVHGRARTTTSMEEDITGGAEWWNTMIADKSDWWMRPFANRLNWFTNKVVGEQVFASGGVVKPLHAEIGTIVPGDSYSGDKTPVLANGGEMILNPMQQKSMFNLISSLALNGGALYGMNKLGGKMGVGGFGNTMLLANLMGGGNAGIIDIIQAHYMKKFIKGMNPFKTSIEGVSNVSKEATEATTTFTSRLSDVTKKWGTIFGNFGKNVSKSIKTYFTTGKLGKVTSFVGNIGRGTVSAAKSTGNFIGTWATKTGKAIAKPFVSVIDDFKKTPLAKDIKAFNESIKSSGYNRKTDRFVTAKGRFKKATDVGGKYAQRIVKTKSYVKEFAKDVKSIFKPSQASNSVTKQSTEIAKAAGNSGKVLSGLKTAGKMVSKKLPYIGAALAVGSAVSGMMNASSQYDDKIDKIESSNMSDYEKARAKDRATKEKNASYGGSIGSAAGGLGGMAAGAAAGAAIGSVIPVVGTAIGGLIGGALGAWGGEKLGGTVGKGVGSLFSGNEVDKLKEEQKAKIEESKENSKLNAKAIESIDKNVAIIAGKNFTIGAKPLASPSIGSIGIGLGKSLLNIVPGAKAFGIAAEAIGKSNVGQSIKKKVENTVEALPIAGNFMKVVPTRETTSAVSGNIGPSDINLKVSGTIKLEGNGKTADFDISKLLDTPEFKRQLAEIIKKETNIMVNAGKERKEYDTGRKERT